MTSKTPREAAIEIEALLRAAGYILGDLSFRETIGGRIATYDFSNTNSFNVDTVEGGTTIVGGNMEGR